MSVQVAQLRGEDTAAAGELLAASHADYPAFAQLFPDPAVRQRVLRAFLTATAADAASRGGALLARDSDRVLGVAMWMPPGTFPLTLLRKARMAPALLRTALAAPHRFPAFARVGARLEHSAHPAPAWYLQAMGVHPHAQRQGIGRKLLTPVLADADTAGIACYLHTSDPANVDYYRQHGFQVTQPATEAFTVGPHYIAMSRPPIKPAP